MEFPTQPSAASFALTASFAPSNSRCRRTPSMERQAKVDGTPPLDGAPVLVVEDDFLILAELESGLTDAGAEVVGPCRDAREAPCRARWPRHRSGNPRPSTGRRAEQRAGGPRAGATRHSVPVLYGT